MKRNLPARAAARLARIKIIYVVAFFFLLYLAIGLTRHLLFHSGGWDLGIFDQTIWQYSHLQIGYNSVRGVSYLLADHFHPILMALAPLYWIYSSPVMLIVAQAALVAAGAWPIYKIAQRKLANKELAIPIAVGYLGFWGILSALAFDFHPIVLVVPLLAFAYYFLETDRGWAMFVMLALMLLVEEDAILMVIGFGVYLFLFRKKRAAGASLVLAAAAWFFLVVGVIMPRLRPDGAAYAYWQHYSYIGPNMSKAGWHLVTHPWLIVQYLFWPPRKWLTIFLLLLPFGFLPLVAPFSIIILPYFVERFLSDFPLHWSPYAHYNAVFAVVFAIAAIEAIAWLEARGRIRVPGARAAPGDGAVGEGGDERRRRFVLNPAWLAMVFVLVALGAVVLRGVWFVKENPPSSVAVAATGYEVMGDIPSGSCVVAVNGAIPHLAQRTNVFLFAGDYYKSESNGQTDWELHQLYTTRDIIGEADYVVLNDKLDTFPQWPEDVTIAIDTMKQDGRFTWRDYGNGWFVFTRIPPPS